MYIKTKQNLYFSIKKNLINLFDLDYMLTLFVQFSIKVHVVYYTNTFLWVIRTTCTRE